MTSTYPSKSMAFEKARNDFVSKLDAKDAAFLDSNAGPEEVLADLQKLEKEHEETSRLRGVMNAIKPGVRGLEQYAKAMDVICNVKPEVLSLLWGGLRIVLRMLSPVYIVIDALDESSDRIKLIKLLLDISASCGLPSSTTEVNMFVTSREESDIKGKLSNLPNMSLNNVMSQDIETFVKWELRRLIDTKQLELRDPSLEDKIRHTLTSKAEGMFQWVRCQFEVVRECVSDKEIQRCLDTLPLGLDETYVRIFSQIKLHHASGLETVRKTFFWLVHSCRPLTLSELAEAATFEPDQVVMDFSALPTDPKKLLRFTGGLIGINDKNSTVYLTHFSVKEFLLSPRILHTEVSDFYSDTIEIKSEQAMTCLKYLMMQVFDSGQCYTQKQLDTRVETYSFLKYAALFWADHCHKAGPLKDLDLLLCDFFTKARYAQNVLAWQQMETYLPFRQMEQDPALNPMHHAAKHGLLGLLRRLQALGYDINEHGGQPCSPLLMAIRSKRLNWHFVGAMIDMGASVHVKDAGGSVASEIANIGGPDQRALLERVIDLGADVHHHLNYDIHYYLSYDNVLESISARPFDPDDLISSLLQKGADPNKHYLGENRKDWQGPPLQRACFAGNMRIVELLLDRGALVSFGHCSLGTPLEAAILGGSTAIVEHLLAIDVNNANILHNGRLLYAAVGAGRLDLVRLFISRGVDVNEGHPTYGSVLNVAIASERHDIINILLQKGASANVHVAKGRKYAALSYRSIYRSFPGYDLNTVQPIVYAIEYGLSDLVRRLIDKGADLNWFQGPCTVDSGVDPAPETHPLCWAIRLSRNDYVELLMSQGANPANGHYCGMLHAATCNNVAFLEKALRVIPDAFMVEAIVLKMLKRCTNQAFYQAIINLIADRKARLPGPRSLAILLIDSLGRANSTRSTRKDFKIPWILEHEFDFNVKPDEGSIDDRTLVPGQAILPLSICHEKPELFDVLLTRNADPNDHHYGYGTPLAAAFERRNRDAMKRLLQHGADPNVCWPYDAKILTASDEFCRQNCLVHRVAAHGSMDIMQLLLQKDADLSQPGDAYASPVWSAVKHENVDMIRYLIQQGADINKRNMYGKSLLSWARDNHRCKATISALEEHSAMVSKETHNVEECSQRLEETVQQIIDAFLSGERKAKDKCVILGRCLALGHDDHNALIALEQIRSGHQVYPNDVHLERHHLCIDADTDAIEYLHSLERHEIQLSREGRLEDHKYLMYPRPFFSDFKTPRDHVTISEGKYMPLNEWLKRLKGWKVNKG